MTGVLDRATEALGRRLAARSTRRSFLGRMGRAAVLVAAGPTVATLLAGRAEARVCGQSGVSPRCPTYDCVGSGLLWGWCWYASGDVCCAGGGLKKICDCCGVDWPNVHGYCPAGTNVYCIVESCWADPRVMSVPLDRLAGGDAPLVAAFVSRDRFPTGTPLAAAPVLADADDALVVAIAAPLAAVDGVPLLLTRRDGLSAAAVAELQRLGATGARLVGWSLGRGVEDDLARYGMSAQRVGTSVDHGPLSEEVGRLVLAAGGPRRVVVLGRDDRSVAAAPSVGAAAAATRIPVLVGSDAARVLGAAWGVGATVLLGGAADDAAGVPAPFPVRAPDGPTLARVGVGALVDLGGLSRYTVWLAAETAPLVLAGLAGTAGVVLPRRPARLDGEAEGWLLTRPDRAARAVWVADDLPDESRYRLQSALNHFDAHRLTGASGEGLPVISQPFPERDIGRARVAGAVPEVAETSGAYWVGRANPARQG